MKLKSEHVAKVMDVGTLETGSPYIVMEYLEGTDLNQLVEKHGPLPFADVAEYVIQACDAIAEAHSLGIVHRDLKPANLFLTRRPDGAPLVKVLDFGISKANALSEAGGGMTKTSTMMGSPYFMSPEQMRSAKDVDARSDVWSVGVIIYQLLTARLPFESDTLGGIMAQVLQDDPAQLTVHRPDVPHAFQAVVGRCIQRDRAQRAQSVAEVAMMLANYAPTRARPIAERIAGLLGATGTNRGGTMIAASPVTSPSSPSTPPPTPMPVVGAAPSAGSISVSGITGATGLPRKGSATGIVIGAVVAGVCLGGGAWWALSGKPAAPQVSATEPPKAPAAAAPAETQAAPAPPPTVATAAPPAAAPVRICRACRTCRARTGRAEAGRRPRAQAARRARVPRGRRPAPGCGTARGAARRAEEKRPRRPQLTRAGRASRAPMLASITQHETGTSCRALSAPR